MEGSKKRGKKFYDYDDEDEDYCYYEETCSIGKKIVGKNGRIVRYCLVATGLSTFILIFTFAYYIGKMSGMNLYCEGREYMDNVDERLDRNETCWDPSCVIAASSILRKMDASVNPCENFYKFSCGNFLRSTVIPDDQGYFNSFTIMRDRVDEELRASIEEADPKDLVAKLYKSCMNKDLIEKRGLKPVEEVLELLGGWPLLHQGSFNAYNFDWEKTVNKLVDIGHDSHYPINFRVGADPINNTKNVIFLDEAPLGLPREFLLKGMKDKRVKAYYNFMLDLAGIFGADKDKAALEIASVLEFEIKLANISLPREKQRKPMELYNPTSLSELRKNYAGVSWRTLIEKQLSVGRVFHDRIKEDESIIVTSPKYFRNLFDLIRSTSTRLHANYIMWRIVAGATNYLNEKIRNREMSYAKEIAGREERAPRWKECVGTVSRGLGPIVGAIYVKKYFKEDSKRSVIEMVDDIKRQMDAIFPKVKWLDEKTRKRAMEKAAAMTKRIAYPAEILNEEFRQLFRGLELSEDRYYENLANITIFYKKYFYGKLRKVADKNDPMVNGNVAVVNAFYRQNDNSIRFPAGILQGDFFSKERPKYMNYGTIGYVIGHEITHGFDDVGRLYDKQGNLGDWWEKSTEKEFLKRANCFIEQYGNYTVIGRNVNGINTLGENIADNGGLKLAYRAYEDWSMRNKLEKRLPGLNFTPRQMFWISTATSWCTKYREKTLGLLLNGDPHAPAELRVLGAMSNAPEFSRDFKCQIGSPMNPRKKCFVW